MSSVTDWLYYFAVECPVALVQLSSFQGTTAASTNKRAKVSEKFSQEQLERYRKAFDSYVEERNGTNEGCVGMNDLQELFQSIDIKLTNSQLQVTSHHACMCFSLLFPLCIYISYIHTCICYNIRVDPNLSLSL